MFGPAQLRRVRVASQFVWCALCCPLLGQWPAWSLVVCVPMAVDPPLVAWWRGGGYRMALVFLVVVTLGVGQIDPAHDAHCCAPCWLFSQWGWCCVWPGLCLVLVHEVSAAAV